MRGLRNIFESSAISRKALNAKHHNNSCRSFFWPSSRLRWYTATLRFTPNIPIIFHKQRNFLPFPSSRIIWTWPAYWWPLSNGLRRKLSEKELFWFSINLAAFFFILSFAHRLELMKRSQLMRSNVYLPLENVCTFAQRIKQQIKKSECELH